MKKILIAVLVILVLVCVGLYFYLSPTTNSGSNDAVQTINGTEIYTNKKLGYSFAIPSGYRVAVAYTELENVSLHDVKNYTLADAENVLITSASESEEKQFVNTLKARLATLDKNSSDYSEFAVSAHFLDNPVMRKSILINANGVTMDRSKASLERNSISYKEVTLADGVRAIRYSAPAVGIEDVDIPFTRQQSLSTGYPIGEISIKMPTDVFDQTSFEVLVNSFKFQ